MEGVRAVRGACGPSHLREGHVVEECIVARRSSPPAGNQVLPMGELDVEQGGLQAVESGVEPHFEVVVFALCPVVGKAPYPRVQVGVAGHHGPSVAERTEVFAREKARGPHRPQHARRSLDAWAAPHGTEALGIVFHQVNPVLLGPGHEGIHVRTLAKQVHHHHGLRPRGARTLGRGGVELEGSGVDVGKDRRGSDFGDDLGGGDEREVGHDDLVFRSHTERTQRKRQGVGAVSTPHHVAAEFEAVVESLLKRCDVLATNERRLGEHLVNGLVQLGTKACVQSPQIHHVDGFVLRAGSVLGRGVGRGVGHRRKAKIARTLGP